MTRAELIDEIEKEIEAKNDRRYTIYSIMDECLSIADLQCMLDYIKG